MLYPNPKNYQTEFHGNQHYLCNSEQHEAEYNVTKANCHSNEEATINYHKEFSVPNLTPQREVNNSKRTSSPTGSAFKHRFENL